MAVYKYKKSQFVKTGAINRYREEKGMSFIELSAKTGERLSDLYRWKKLNIAPRPVLEKLGIKARNSVKANNENHQKGGSFYACYVGAEHKAVFETICKSLGISAKFVV